MEQIRSNLKYSLIAIFIITGTMALDFMTLHDIFNDYLSPDVLSRLHIARDFPTWTAADLEWSWIRITFITRLILLAALFFLVYQSFRMIKSLENRNYNP